MATIIRYGVPWRYEQQKCQSCGADRGSAHAVEFAQSLPYDDAPDNPILSYDWKELMMATKLPGETYRGNTLHVPLSADGQIAAYVWPLRILSIRGEGCGGPTLGIEVGNEEVIRFDCHDTPGGHWHGGGYDRLQTPRASHRDFPETVTRVAEQVDWALAQIERNGKALLEEAAQGEAAAKLDPDMVHTALSAIRAHLDQYGDLRSQAIEEKLITM